MKKLSEHPFAIFIGLISSVIGIFVFVTGIADLRHFFKDGNTTPVEETIKTVGDSLKTINISEDKLDNNDTIDIPYLSRKTRLSQTLVQNDDLYFFKSNIPKKFTIKTKKFTEGENLVEDTIFLNIENKKIPILVMQIKRDKVVDKNERDAFFEGFTGRLLKGKEKNEEDELKPLSDKFRYFPIGGHDFYYLPLKRVFYDGFTINETMFGGFANNHFVSIVIYSVTKEQNEEVIDLLMQIQFYNGRFLRSTYTIKLNK